MKYELNIRDIGGPGFVQVNIFFPKLDEIITYNNVTTNQSTRDREEKVLHLVEDKVSSEDIIIFALEE